MSKLSFEIFCIEHYADKVNRESCKVYEQFKKEGLLKLLILKSTEKACRINGFTAR